MNKNDPKELKTIVECLKNPFFYIISFILIVISNYLSNIPLSILIIFIASLTMLTFIDKKYMILPDIITLPMIPIGIIINYIIYSSYMPYISGALSGFLLFFLVFYISYKIKGTPSMGFGDVKLLSMLGAWVGILNIPLILIYSSLLALVFILFKDFYKKEKKDTPFPYGPFLCLSALISIIYSNETWLFILNISNNINKFILG